MAKPLASKPSTPGSNPGSPANLLDHLTYEAMIDGALDGLRVISTDISQMYWDSNDLSKLLDFWVNEQHGRVF